MTWFINNTTMNIFTYCLVSEINIIARVEKPHRLLPWVISLPPPECW